MDIKTTIFTTRGQVKHTFLKDIKDTDMILRITIGTTHLYGIGLLSRKDGKEPSWSTKGRMNNLVMKHRKHHRSIHWYDAVDCFYNATIHRRLELLAKRINDNWEEYDILHHSLANAKDIEKKAILEKMEELDSESKLLRRAIDNDVLQDPCSEEPCKRTCVLSLNANNENPKARSKIVCPKGKLKMWDTKNKERLVGVQY